jgi:hypothetical protein
MEQIYTKALRDNFWLAHYVAKISIWKPYPLLLNPSVAS